MAAKTVTIVIRAQLRDAVMGRLSPTSPLTRRLTQLSRVSVGNRDGRYRFVGTPDEVRELLACAHRWSPDDVPALRAVVATALTSEKQVLVPATAPPPRTTSPVEALRRFASVIG
jgi:hypothetical protein